MWANIMKLEDFNTLSLARAHPVTSGRLIHRDTMNSLLGKADIYIDFKALALDASSRFQNIVAAFLDSKEYNFIVGDPIGDDLILLLDSMIASKLNMSPALALLRPKLILASNPISHPFLHKTELDFKIAKGTITRKPITTEHNTCTIVTNADCESHTPQIYQKLTYIDGSIEFDRVAGFGPVSTASRYRTHCRSLPNLYVDDAYGVIV